MKATISVYGATGYAGAELIRILSGHPQVTIADAFGGSMAGRELRSSLPWPARACRLPLVLKSIDQPSEGSVAFLALPATESALLAPKLIAEGKRVIDLSGAFRIEDSSEFESYYNEAQAPQPFGLAYGLPEWNREAIRESGLVANPGCYATSVILALAPLLKAGLIHPNDISICSMSGASGAGRKASLELNFTEVNENVRAYRPTNHQHVPEIRQVLRMISGQQVSFDFVPHLIPISRGIYTTITAKLIEGVSEAAVADAFEVAYSAAPFVSASAEVPELRSVQHTNSVKIGYQHSVQTGKLILFSALDNLQKGASGQAVQNLNVMLGLPEDEGLW